MRKTLGTTRSVHLSLDAAWPTGSPVPAGARIEDTGHGLHADLTDLGPSLSTLVTAVGQNGRQVTDIKLTGATLHEVFIALTGRELRE